MSIQLPTTKTPALRKSPRYLLIYGPPKIGKTTILSQLEDNLILDLESGSDFLEALKLGVNSYQEYREVCQKICETNPRPYKYVSIDTVSKLEEWAEVIATYEYKSSVLGKNFTERSVLERPKGAGYLNLRTSFIDLLQLAYPLAKHVIFVGHVRDKLLEENGKEVTCKAIDLTGKIGSIMCSSVDAVGSLARDKDGNLGINFRSSEQAICGGRCEHLRGQAFWFEGNKFDWSKIFID